MRFICLGFILMIFFNCSQENKNDGFLEIQKEEYSIQYPENLSIDKSIAGLEFIIYTEKSHEDDDFIENINLMIQNLDSIDIDLHQFAELSQDQVLDSAGEVISIDLKKNNQHEYYRMITKIPLSQQELNFLQHFYVHNKKAYILTFSSEIDEFENYKKDMEDVMLSFKFRKN